MSIPKGASTLTNAELPQRHRYHLAVAVVTFTVFKCYDFAGSGFLAISGLHVADVTAAALCI